MSKQECKTLNIIKYELRNLVPQTKQDLRNIANMDRKEIYEILIIYNEAMCSLLECIDIEIKNTGITLPKKYIIEVLIQQKETSITK